GADQREGRGHFFECARFHGAQQAAHAGRFNLEDAHGAAFGDDRAGGGIVFGNGGEIDGAGLRAGCDAVGGYGRGKGSRGRGGSGGGIGNRREIPRFADSARNDVGGRDGKRLRRRLGTLFLYLVYLLYFLNLLLNVVQRQRHRGEPALAEQVHLDQAEGFDGVHIILRDDDALGGAFQRDKMRQRARGITVPHGWMPRWRGASSSRRAT